MAVYQETGMPAVSLPNGANHFPLQFLPYFDKFKRIYLWLDADDVGRNASEKFAQKLGSKRTVIIDSRMKDPEGPKDANDALRRGMDFKEIFEHNARSLGDKNLLTFSDLKEKVLARILNYEELSGIQSTQFNFYNKTLKGFRRGELTLITGATGSGKTTFLS
jgi:twinkle protein